MEGVRVAPWEGYRVVDEGMYYLDNSGIEIEGMKFWGSPWTPQYGAWEFMYRRGEPAQILWSQIPTSVNVLLTHGPSYGILDEWDGDPVGCEELQYRIQSLENLKLHVCGHIHPARGQTQNALGTQFVNAALVDNRNRPAHQPILIDL